MPLKMNKPKISKISKEKIIKMKETINSRMNSLAQIMNLSKKSKNLAPIKNSIKIMMDKVMRKT